MGADETASFVFAFAGARPPEKRPLAAEGAAFFGGAFFFGATRFFGAARAPPVNMLTSVTRATAAGDDGSRLAAWRAAVAARAEVRYSIVICGANETHVGWRSRGSRDKPGRQRTVDLLFLGFFGRALKLSVNCL